MIGMMGMIVSQLKRVAPDAALGILLIWLFFSGAYSVLPAPVQLIALKVILVSMAFVHAHVVGKLAFPSVNWRVDHSPAAWLRIALYVVFIFAYSTGG